MKGKFYCFYNFPHFLHHLLLLLKFSMSPNNILDMLISQKEYTSNCYFFIADLFRYEVPIPDIASADAPWSPFSGTHAVGVILTRKAILQAPVILQRAVLPFAVEQGAPIHGIPSASSSTSSTINSQTSINTPSSKDNDKAGTSPAIPTVHDNEQ